MFLRLAPYTRNDQRDERFQVSDESLNVEITELRNAHSRAIRPQTTSSLLRLNGALQSHFDRDLARLTFFFKMKLPSYLSNTEIEDIGASLLH